MPPRSHGSAKANSEEWWCSSIFKTKHNIVVLKNPLDEKHQGSSALSEIAFKLSCKCYMLKVNRFCSTETV